MANTNLNAYKDMDRLIKSLRTTPRVLARVLYDNRDEFIEDILKKYSKGKDPYGKKWVKRKHNYPWPIMDKTGKMKKSYRAEEIDTGVKIINDAPYAITHQYGLKNDRGIQLPQRLVLPTEEKGLPAQFANIARRNILKTLRKTMPKGAKPKKLVY